MGGVCDVGWRVCGVSGPPGEPGPFAHAPAHACGHTRQACRWPRQARALKAGTGSHKVHAMTSTPRCSLHSNPAELGSLLSQKLSSEGSPSPHALLVLTSC